MKKKWLEEATGTQPNASSCSEIAGTVMCLILLYPLMLYNLSLNELPSLCPNTVTSS